MHIGFQKSGTKGEGPSASKGRGEYEVISDHGARSAIGLESWFFNLRWPDGHVRDTALWLDPGNSKKARLRSTLLAPKDKYLIGRMVAAMLMLPDPTRDKSKVGSGEPIAVAKAYLLDRVGFGPETEFADLADMLTIDPSYVSLRNKDCSVQIGVSHRWAREVAVYESVDHLPQAVQPLLNRHREIMGTGERITAELSKVVTSLSKAVTSVDESYSEGHDPLPALERLAGIPPPDGPMLPPPGDIGLAEPEVSARAAQQYRLAKMRGPGAKQFARAVRNAYGNRCAFCGARLGGLEGIKSGVDAAHILAWSRYDLDVVSNGLTLCKLHHWAFDEALVVPVLDAGGYRLRFTSLSKQIEAESRARLGQDGSRLPDEWWPASPALRPNDRYLLQFYQDLDVSFL